MAGTDSFRLGTITFDAPDCADGAFLISATLTAKLCKAYNRSTVNKLKRDQGYAIVFTVPESIQSLVTVSLAGDTIIGPQMGGTFPDWRQLLVSEVNYAIEATAYNPGFLSDLGKIANEIGADTGIPVKVLHMNAFTPGMFTMHVRDFGTFTYALMPVRIS